jgi:hypothetical protein
MTCPICNRPSAINSTERDRRCGPCHNFGVVGINDHAIVIRHDFNEWVGETTKEIEEANNMETYASWLKTLEDIYDATD